LNEPRPDFANLPRTSTTFAGSWLWRQHWVHRRDLLRELIARDMSLRYRGSALGITWTLLYPLAQLLVLASVFSSILPLNIHNYTAFLFIGLLAYDWFTSGLLFATGAIVNNRELMRRPGVPTRILPIVAVSSTLLHFLLSLPILFALLVANHVKITSAILVLPLLIGVQFTLILSLAYPLCIIHVWFRDTQYFLRVALQLLFYLTPVFYQADAIPAQYQAYYRLNPMVPLLDAYRDVLLLGVLPAFGQLLIVGFASCVLLLAGLTVFWYTSHLFVDEL
jgi:lipopolysaccharide transport system permease protein